MEKERERERERVRVRREFAAGRRSTHRKRRVRRWD